MGVCGSSKDKPRKTTNKQNNNLQITNESDNNGNTNKNNPKPVEEKLEFKKIKESSNASKIG